LLLVGAVCAPAVMGKVYVRWTQNKFPLRKVLGADEVVIPWSQEAPGRVAEAKKRGYQVYFETAAEQVSAAAAAGVQAGIAGIILRGFPSEEKQLEENAIHMRANYPKLKFLVLSANGKKPEMRGWLVFNKNGILQVSNPSSQPWLDQNLAVVRYERAFETVQSPLYTFSWDASDPLMQSNGPSPADYSLAIAEAGAFHADLILEVHERQQKGLLDEEKETLADWQSVKRTIAFYERGEKGEREAAAVAVLTDDYDSSYEAINLMARHNIPFRVLHSADVKTSDLAGYEVVVAFAALGKDLTEAIRAFAERGGVAVLVNRPGPYPWESPAGKTENTHSMTYTVGKGRVIELRGPLSDPETFAQDIRRLMAKQQIPLSLWNSLTTLVVEYPGEKQGETIVELVNYDEEATEVQVRVKGTYGSVKFESPDRSCCETLKPAELDGFTEFVVPNLVIGGRVRLEATQSAPKDKTNSKAGS
jgi:hypothetical protein